MVKAPFYDKNGVKKGAWSAEEDNKLRAYVQRYGHWNWREIPKFAGLQRCGKSCRLRWMNYLRPDVKHGNYSDEEEELILKLHEEFGNKWSMIATKLPGRTDNEIKNYWHTHLKKRAATKSDSTASDNHVEDQSICGENLQWKDSENGRDSEAESVFVSNTIVESSPLSPEATFSIVSCDHDHASDYSFNTELDNNNNNMITSWETFQISSEDFWTQPFVVDKSTYNHDDDSNNQLSFQEERLLSPFVSYFDDNVNLFY